MKIPVFDHQIPDLMIEDRYKSFYFSDICEWSLRRWECLYYPVFPAFQRSQNISDISADTDGFPPNLIRSEGLLVIDAGVDSLWILVSHSPEGVLDDAGGIMFIAHQK